MEFKTQDYSHEVHHEALSQWWERQDFPVVPPQLLPKTGFVVVGEDSQDYCAGFLFSTDSAYGWLEFVVGNPDVDKGLRRQAVELLIKALLGAAKEKGFQVVVSSLDAEKRPGLLETYRKTGFVPTEVSTFGIWGVQ